MVILSRIMVNTKEHYGSSFVMNLKILEIMKNEYHQFETPSILYIIISELIFLKEIRKANHYVTKSLTFFYSKLKARYQKFIQNEWTQAYLVLSGYMAVSTLLLLAAYQLVIVF